PVLDAASDGVGTKLLVAQALDRHDTVGIDLVAMVVDDVVVTGAEPLFVLDYLAVGRVVPERVAAIVAGVAEGCRRARCALLGGETAEHPDAMAPDAYDLAGFAVGMVERERLLGPDRVVTGGVLLGLASTGLHANGVRRGQPAPGRGGGRVRAGSPRARRPGRRGAAHPDPHLRPRPGRPHRHRDRGPRPLPHHRRRPSRQPPPLPPPRPHRPGRPRVLGAAADLQGPGRPRPRPRPR